MKHLKVFENKENNMFGIFYLVDTEDSNSNYVRIFDDLESARNYYIDFANESKRNDVWRENNRDMNNDEYITTVEEAKKYIDDELYTLIIEYDLVKSQGKFELPEDIQLARDAKKYNV